MEILSWDIFIKLKPTPECIRNKNGKFNLIFTSSFAGFLSWDMSECHVDLEEELSTITQQALEGEEGKHGKY